MISAMHAVSGPGHSFVVRPATIRAFVLPATLAISALLSTSQAWATAAATTTTLTVTNAGGSDVTSVAAGTVVTLTATVVSGSTPVNPGQVKFCDASAKYCEDSALLGTAQLSNARVATYKFRPGVGSHSYQAVFVGTNKYAKSTSTAADLTVTVTGLYPTTATIASSRSIGNYTLAATVVGTASSSLSLTGEVSFLDTTNGNASLGTAALGTATPGVFFSTGSTPGVNGGPYSVAVGDFNGDGILDLATANVNTNSVTVLLGNGDGTFTFKSSPGVGANPWGIAVGDFNGDGIPDLVTANSGTPGTVTVLLGNGDGTFTTKSTPGVGTQPYSVAVGDFNGDGIPDLATANKSDNTVTVLLGNGDGTFTTKSTLSVGESPEFVAIGDFNGDGIQDLAVANFAPFSEGTSVSILLGKGDGTFISKSTPAAFQPFFIAVGDFNGDGIQDLAVADYSFGVTILLGNGDGTFTNGASPAVGNGSASIAVGDFNGDGIPDLVVTEVGFDTATVLLGKGDGTFITQPTVGVGGYPNWVAVGDLNGDGTPDIVTANFTSASVSVLLNQITETATATLSNVSVSGIETHQVLASYPGNVNYAASTSSTVPLLAAQIATKLNLSSSANSSIAGNQVTLTATLSPYVLGTFATNGETVTFYSGKTSIGTATLSAGVATFMTTALPAGSDQLTAVYAGDANFSGSTSNAVSVTIQQVATTLQLYSSTNPSTQGAPTTLTVVFSPTYSGNFTVTGETVSFYNGGSSIGSAPLSFGGVATLTVSTLPNGIDKLTASYTSDGIFASATSNTVSQAVGVTFPPIPNFIVTVKTDTTAGVASNCTSAPALNCSLRDALAAAFANGSGNITFSPTVFATAQTITLGNAGGLSIPPYTTITGPTTGSGASLTNLVTVNGGGPVFTVGSYVTDAVISNLTITGGSAGGIVNGGALLVSDSTISGNSGSFSFFLVSGGGIENYGTLTLIDSTVAGNSVTVAGTTEGTTGQGGGIDNQGTLTIINSSVVGNSVAGYAYAGISNAAVFGGGINNNGKLTMINSIVAGNSATAIVEPGALGDAGATGGGIQGGLTGANNIISGNTTNGSEDDCDGSGCPTNGVTGNVIGPSALASLGNYGGPTQTAPPLPGSTAICAGVVADVPSGVTTDQRGLPRTTTYDGTPCVDSGPVQTKYALSFSIEPPASVPQNSNFTAAVQLSESGSPFPVSGVTIRLALATGNPGSLNVSSLTTSAAGLASSSQLQVIAPGTADTLVATLPVTTTPPPASLTSAISISTTSSAFSVTPPPNVQVTVGTSPTGLAITVDGVNGIAPVTETWTIGSQHTLATISPQLATGARYTFTGWSDGTSTTTDSVTASSSGTAYTAAFSTAYLLTTSATAGGTVSPASGNYYAAGTVVTLTATPNPGYYFAGWTGSVASSTSASTTVTMSAPEAVTANFAAIPSFVVTVATDDAGTASNCTNQNLQGATPDVNCSLRDALAASAANGGNITFRSTVFATPQTISLTNGTLNMPSNTTIAGPTSGSGATSKNLVTLNGAGQYTFPINFPPNQYRVFTINSGVTNAAIAGLTITGGLGVGTAGGIVNAGVLTVSGCTISGNSSPYYTDGEGGAGITNYGTLTLINSTVAGNSAGGGPLGGPQTQGILGGGILNEGTMTVTNSAIVNNSDSGPYGSGGGIENWDTLTVTDSVISGNGVLSSGNGGGIGNGGTLTVSNSIVSGNATNGLEDDCDSSNGGQGCPTNGTAGNIVGVPPLLAPLGNYGGPTPTMPPLPGSPAICAGLIADIASGVTTDQRGFPRTTTYGGNPPCVDSGSVQTNYALSFSTEPPASVPPSANFAAALQLSESGSPFSVSGVAIPIALAAGDPGSLNVTSLSTSASGIAGSRTLQVSAEGTGDALVATLPLTTTPPLTAPISIIATSSAFNVEQTSQTITFTAPATPVTFGVGPIMLYATASSGLPVTFSVISGPATVSGSTLTITGAGTIVVAANQAGNADYTAAAQVTQTIIVNKATPSLSLMVTPATPTYGTPLTFTGASAPAGSTSIEFSFLIDKGTANSVILSATILANGTVTATDGQLKAGAHIVELDFTGTPNYAAATSPIVPVSVTQATPTITWAPAGSIPYGTNAASLLSATANTPGSFTYTAQAAGSIPVPLTSATVLAAGSYTLTVNFAPTDTVDYKSATQTSQLAVADKTLTVTANNAARVYGTANPTFTGTVVGAVNGDAFTETFLTTATTSSNVGTYAIVPSVTGPNLADYAVTVKNGMLTLTQAASTTALTSSTSNANLNASVMFTATVISSTSGTPGGAVQFLDGSTVLGMSPLNSQGVAAYSTTELFAGSNAINAVYAGDQNFTGSMAELMQQVTAPAFSLKSSASQLSLIGGDTGQLTITLTPVGGYTGMTSFSCAGLPQNATCSFNPPTLTADGSNSPVTTTMTITTHGPGSGTVGLLRPQSPGTSALLASLAGLPACLAGLTLFWQRRRLSPPVRRPFCAVLLIGGLAGSVAISACGGSSQPKTPPGTSTFSVMATGSGNTSQSIMITLTVAQ